jgi:hypothetical protein
MRATGILRYSRWDGLLVALSLVHAVALIAVPSVPLVAIGLWWNANTVSHNFIHSPFFRSRRTNILFACFLTLLLGFPHELWRARHLAHHAGREHVAVKWTRRLWFETVLVAGLWVSLLAYVPRLFAFVYLPGYLIGLALCQLQGYFEHAGGTTSHYGWFYNFFFFRDGLHVEHHAKPATHWTRLEPADAHSSAWPPVLRWLDATPALLDALERLVLRSLILQRLVIRCHGAAIASALARLPEIKSVAIIGGGLFPRTAIIMRRLLPEASITIVDRNAEHLRCVQQFLGSSVEILECNCDASMSFNADLLVLPLAFVGDRNRYYDNPPAHIVLIHDWIWRRRGDGARVSWFLLKRINVVRRASSSARPTEDSRAA